VPLVPLRTAFELPVVEMPRQELLLTQYGEQRVGVVVDHLLGRVQTVIQPLDESMADVRQFSGATILGDGSICLILDLASVVGQARREGPVPALAN
jgi:two-component system chemotaxis sensor kinase CheA